MFVLSTKNIICYLTSTSTSFASQQENIDNLLEKAGTIRWLIRKGTASGQVDNEIANRMKSFKYDSFLLKIVLILHSYMSAISHLETRTNTISCPDLIGYGAQ